jgi:hypothetical protein
MAAMRPRDSDQLAAKLGRPAATLSAFRGLSAEQIGLLSDAIDEAAATRRRDIDQAFRAALPALPRRLVLWTLRLAEGGAGAPNAGSRTP